MTKASGPTAGARVVIEGPKGRAKGAVGAVVGGKWLSEEGRAQQDRAGALRDVAVKEAEVDASRAEAAAHEANQRALQD